MRPRASTVGWGVRAQQQSPCACSQVPGEENARRERSLPTKDAVTAPSTTRAAAAGEVPFLTDRAGAKASMSSLLTRKGVLAIAAVVDVALRARARPVSAKALATRHGLPARHLEPVLRSLVHGGILRGVRGLHGGYILARERHRIGIDEIVRAAGTVNDRDKAAVSSTPIAEVLSSAIAEAERVFSEALSQINVNDLACRAETSAHSVHRSVQETERAEPRP
jgi:Rrf2 family iron-sulfur cluster assembly transcriptional regulator